MSLPRFSVQSKSRCFAAEVADMGTCDEESVPAERHFLSSGLDRAPAKRVEYLPGTGMWGFEVHLPSKKATLGNSSTRAWLNDASWRPASHPQQQRPARISAVASGDELIQRIHKIGVPTGLFLHRRLLFDPSFFLLLMTRMGPGSSKSGMNRPDMPEVDSLRMLKTWGGAPNYADDDTWEDDVDPHNDLHTCAVSSRNRAHPYNANVRRLPLEDSKADQAGTGKQHVRPDSSSLRACNMSVFGWSWFGKSDE